MPVADILKAKGSSVISVNAKDPVTAAINKLNDNRIGALVVLDAQAKVVGIISERDLAKGLAEYGERLLLLRVENLMTKHLHVCKPQDRIKDVMKWMTNYRVRHLPVIEDGNLRGMISIGDVVKHRLYEVQTEANVLRDIVIAGS